MDNYTYYIGIDTGKNTGLAIWNAKEKRFIEISTKPIHRQMTTVAEYLSMYELEDVKIRFEDARKRKWFGKAGREQLQGAGSIKRDAVIWEDFLTDWNANYDAVAPKNNKTKLDTGEFEKITGWNLRTSEHSRDAAMLVFGL